MPFENTQLQCFNSHLYASVAEFDRVPRQCIAPTKQKQRCRWNIDDHDLSEARELRRQAQSLPDSWERDQLIADFVLLRCCSQWHRDKLGADRTGCLEELVDRYGASLGQPYAEARSSHQTMSTTSDIYQNYVAQLPHQVPGMQLRSRTVFTNAPGTLRRTAEYFVPYKSDPKDSILDELLQDIPWEIKRTPGEVYSFTWPLYPGFSKIGYTRHGAENRVWNWQECHAGATLSSSEQVEYPERIERLVHLELARHRHRIIICTQCSRGHEEWFKTPSSEVSQVISDWAEVAQREPLYGDDDRLTPRWWTRITNFRGDIRARGLLDLLDAEEDMERERHHRIASQAVPVVVPSFTPMALPTYAPMIHQSFTPATLPTNTPVMHQSFTPMDLPTYTPVMHQSFTPMDLPTYTPVMHQAFTPATLPTYAPVVLPPAEVVPPAALPVIDTIPPATESIPPPEPVRPSFDEVIASLEAKIAAFKARLADCKPITPSTKLAVTTFSSAVATTKANDEVAEPRSSTTTEAVVAAGEPLTTTPTVPSVFGGAPLSAIKPATLPSTTQAAVAPVIVPADRLDEPVSTTTVEAVKPVEPSPGPTISTASEAVLPIVKPARSPPEVEPTAVIASLVADTNTSEATASATAATTSRDMTKDDQDQILTFFEEFMQTLEREHLLEDGTVVPMTATTVDVAIYASEDSVSAPGGTVVPPVLVAAS